METEKSLPLDIIRVGPSVNLIQLNTAAKDFGISSEEFAGLLDELQIPSIAIADRDYFNLFALERALFVYLQECGRAPQSDDAVLLEMAVAGLTYAAASRESLKARLAKLAESIRLNCARSHHKPK